VFCASGPISDPTMATQPFFTRAMTQPGLAVGNYWVDPTTKQRLIHFAERFEDDQGVVAGVVFAGLDLAWLSEHLKERGLSATASILIADREGNIIARLPHPELLVGKNMRQSREAIMDGDTTGWEEAVGVDVIEHDLVSALIGLKVAGTGIGIPVGKLDQIFEPFAQGDSSTIRRYGAPVWVSP